MRDWLTGVASVLDSLEEILEGFSDDGRVLSSARDVVRLVAWVRAQPRVRGLVLAALSAGLLVGAALLNTHRRTDATERPRTASNLPVVDPHSEDDWQ